MRNPAKTMIELTSEYFNSPHFTCIINHKTEVNKRAIGIAFLCFLQPNIKIISAIENITKPIIGSIPNPNKDIEPILIINGASKQ